MADDAGLFAPIVTGDELLAATSDRAWLQAMLDVEAALAIAEAEAGIIPAEAAAAIAAICQSGNFDLNALGRSARVSRASIRHGRLEFGRRDDVHDRGDRSREPSS